MRNSYVRCLAAGADVARPVLGHRAPCHISFAAHSAQHSHRRWLHVADCVSVQQSTAVATRRRLLLLCRSAAVGLHQRQHLLGRQSPCRPRLLRLLFPLRLCVSALRNQLLVRTVAAASAPPGEKGNSVSSRSASATVSKICRHNRHRHHHHRHRARLLTFVVRSLQLKTAIVKYENNVF